MTTVTAKQKKSIAQVQLALKLLCVPTEFHLLTSTNEIRILDIQIHIKKGGWISFLEEIQQTQYVPTQGGKTVKLETCGQRQEKQGKRADEVVSRR